MPRPRICVIGSLNMDLVMRTPRLAQAGETIMGGPFATFPGGKGANQAVAAARLGAQVSFVGCVGDDAYGTEFHRVLRKEGIDCSHLFTKTGETTGVAMIVSDAQSQNSIVVALGANLALTAANIDAAMPVMREADVVMLQLEIPLGTIERVLRRSEEFKATIMLNAAPAQQVPRRLLEKIDVLVFNEIEARALVNQVPEGVTDDALIQLVPYGGNAIKVLTLADHGSMTCMKGDHVQMHPPFTVKAVDSVGAGDAFCSALAVMNGEEDLALAIRFASAAGALAVTRNGAIPSLPTREEVESFLRERRPMCPNGSPPNSP